MEREYQVSSQGSENVKLKVAYFPRLHFLLIGEKALAFISDEPDVFMMVRRYDNRRACIAPDNSKMPCVVYQVVYTTAADNSLNLQTCYKPRCVIDVSA